VKLLFDKNLSVRLPSVLADVYPGSAHVHYRGLGSADDSYIWQYAKDNSFTIVSIGWCGSQNGLMQGI